jgi:redox-sensitive bicupin YhaK (pirin superfamily)
MNRKGLIAMNTRTVKHVFPAVREDIADLQTWRAMPTQYIDHLDPFLFLNHHGRQIYPPGNHGLPFGPHPHRGFETVTFILEGDIAHRDSGGHESVIGPQGVQWMTAGRGLVHSETSSEQFKEKGGPLEVLQLWVNLPARLKMTAPRYIGLQGDQLPVHADDSGRVSVQLVSGTWQGKQGPIMPLTDISCMLLNLKADARLQLSIALDHNVFFYVVRGNVEVNGQAIDERHLADFDHDGEQLDITATQDSLVLLCHALPFGEPIIAHGPFVMNTKEEIRQAISDYQAGLFNV